MKRIFLLLFAATIAVSCNQSAPNTPEQGDEHRYIITDSTTGNSHVAVTYSEHDSIVEAQLSNGKPSLTSKRVVDYVCPCGAKGTVVAPYSIDTMK